MESREQRAGGPPTEGRERSAGGTEEVAYGPPASTEERGHPGQHPETTGAGGPHPPGPEASDTARSKPATEPSGEADGAMPLLAPGDTEGFERRWQDIQVGFVDEPRNCVEQADGLVAEVMKRLAEGFAEERRSLEGQWDRGDQVSTEDLRVALQRYRSFFNRLLSTSG